MALHRGLEEQFPCDNYHILWRLHTAQVCQRVSLSDLDPPPLRFGCDNFAGDTPAATDDWSHACGADSASVVADGSQTLRV